MWSDRRSRQFPATEVQAERARRQRSSPARAETAAGSRTERGPKPALNPGRRARWTSTAWTSGVPAGVRATDQAAVLPTGRRVPAPPPGDLKDSGRFRGRIGALRRLLYGWTHPARSRSVAYSPFF